MARRRINIWRDATVAVAVALAVMVAGFLGLIVARPILQREGLVNTLCIVDRRLVFGRSALGVSANMQLRQLQDGMQGEITAEKALIDRTPDQANASARLAALQARVQQENVRLERVRVYAIGLIIHKIAPIIRREAAKARCTSVLDRSAIIDDGSTVDLTAPVVNAIDSDVPPLPTKSLEDALKLR